MRRSKSGDPAQADLFHEPIYPTRIASVGIDVTHWIEVVPVPAASKVPQGRSPWSASICRNSADGCRVRTAPARAERRPLRTPPAARTRCSARAAAPNS